MKCGGGGLTYDGLASHTGIVRIPSSPPPPHPPLVAEIVLPTGFY